METHRFRYKTNSLLAATLSISRSHTVHPNRSLDSWPTKSSLNTLGTVSALYIYTNPPPMGYGSPAPKVAESVIRSMDYNRNPPDRRETIIDSYIINVPRWEGPANEYPFQEVHGNFHPGACHRMFLKQLMDNREPINETVQSVMNHQQNTNSSVLTKGRQTWCPLTKQSLPSASAYNNMAAFFKTNTGKNATTCLEWMKCFFTCLEKSELTATLSEEYGIQTFKVDPVTRQKVPRVRIRRKLVTVKVTGDDECYRFIMDLARSFCSYIKHGERAKLNRRAIASANPILRMFLYAIEEFHLRLSKLMLGSTIGVGGEEKNILEHANSHGKSPVYD